jgi:hypothetical protein
MSDDEIDPSVLFSSDSYEMILALLATDEDCEISGLQALIRTFVYGNQDVLGDFPVVEVATRLVELLDTTQQSEIRDLSSNCMQNFLEAHSESTRALIEAGALPVLARTLGNFAAEMLGSNCLKVLFTISEYRPGDIGRQIGIEPLLTHFEQFRVHQQRSASLAALRVTAEFNDDSFAKNANLIVRCILMGDTIVKSNLGQALVNVIRGSKQANSLDLGILPPLIRLVNEAEDGPCANAFIGCVRELSDQLSFGKALLPNQINFERLFFGPDFKGSTSQIRRAALNIILNLLPDVDLPGEFWILNGRRLALSDDFAREVQPLALKLLFAKVGRDNLILATIASTMIVQPIGPTERLLEALAVLAPLPELAPYVLLVVKSFPDPSVIIPYQILLNLAQITPDEKVKQWYAISLQALRGRIKTESPGTFLANRTFPTFESLCDFLTTQTITPFQFRSSGLLDQAHDFLQRVTAIEPVQLPAIEKIIELAHGVLMLLPNFARIDPLSDFSPDQLLTRCVYHDLKFGEEVLPRVSIGIDLDLSALEAWGNRRAQRVPYERIAEALAASEFKELLILPDSAQMLLTHTALLSRGLAIPELVKYHFKIGGQLFSSHDCLFHALARSLPDPKSFNDARLIEFCEGDIPRAPVVVPLDIEPSLLVSFRLLEQIHKLLPLINVSRPEFTRQIETALSSPLLTIGFHSLQSRILYHFPFLLTDF